VLQIAARDMCFILDFNALASTDAGVDETQPNGTRVRTSLKALTVSFLAGLFGDPGILKVGWGFFNEDVKRIKKAANGKLHVRLEPLSCRV
jgi:hypothetical protein